MKRITDRNLEAVVARINRMTGSPIKPYVEGQPQANCYLLDYAYGRVALHRMMPTGTGQREIISRGTKRELYDQLFAFIAGLEART